MAAQILPLALRSQLLQQLAAGERAGLALSQTLASLHLPPPQHAGLAQVQRAIARGETLSRAGARAGWFSPPSASQIAAGETAGCLAAVLQRLAAQENHWLLCWRECRARLALPLLLFLLSSLLAPLPALAAGTLSLGSALMGILIKALLIVALLYIPWQVYTAIRNEQPHGHWLLAGLMHIPIIQRYLWDYVLCRWLNHWAGLIHAGIDPASASAHSQVSMTLPQLQRACLQLSQLLQQGMAISVALLQLGWPWPASTISRISVAEASGTLADLLLNLAAEMQHQQSARLRKLSRLIPRVLYVLIGVGIVRGLV
ncbi:type II secretion system F family protein [Chitinibacter tainanensis]|uniref:type II secretion system F family protein n=1 Tax=Chitinibacter tainanensis TaxID=230667 RepID=UPI002354AC51|nr:type II secretion system F family protein [Chitinibacter tainanensis]